MRAFGIHEEGTFETAITDYLTGVGGWRAGDRTKFDAVFGVVLNAPRPYRLRLDGYTADPQENTDFSGYLGFELASDQTWEWKITGAKGRRGK